MKLIRFTTLVVLTIMLTGTVIAQNAVIGLSNTFTSPDPTCGYWCWFRAIKNILPHYGQGSVTEYDIIELARENRYFNIPDSITCNVCSFPNSCCCYTMNSSNVVVMLSLYGLIGGFSGVLSPSSLEEHFLSNRPVLIVVSGGVFTDSHVFIAHGIYGDLVHIIDGDLGECTRPYYNIYPGSYWVETFKFLHSPNCSEILVAGGIVKNTGTICFEATNRIESSSAIPSGNEVYFISEGEVHLKPGFYVRQTSSLEIITGATTSCP